MKVEDGLFEGGLQPGDKLIRYVSFSKLMSMLTRSALYLSRADKFPDPLEGWWPQTDLDYLVDRRSGVGSNAANALRNLHEARGKAYVSCWAKYINESDAHWRLYAAKGEAVAIITTSEKLRSVFDNWTAYGANASFGLGPVRLVDHLHDQIANEQSDGYRKSLLRVFTLKNASFRWEDEARAIVFPRNGEWKDDGWPSGIEAPIDSERLIDRIIVGPNAEPWFLDMVRACVESNGLQDRIVNSELVAFVPPL